jgi:Protein of unknown function (DUF3244).
MKKLIFSFSLLFCLFFTNIEARPVSIDSRENKPAKENNRVELMGDLPIQSTRSLNKPIILFRNWDMLEATFVDKLRSITIEILDETNSPVYKHFIDTDTQYYYQITISNFRNGEYLIVLTDDQGYYLKGSFTIKK